jgi:hypothetical protein
MHFKLKSSSEHGNEEKNAKQDLQKKRKQNYFVPDAFPTEKRSKRQN